MSDTNANNEKFAIGYSNVSIIEKDPQHKIWWTRYSAKLILDRNETIVFCLKEWNKIRRITIHSKPHKDSKNQRFELRASYSVILIWYRATELIIKNATGIMKRKQYEYEDCSPNKLYIFALTGAYKNSNVYTKRRRNIYPGRL